MLSALFRHPAAVGHRGPLERQHLQDDGPTHVVNAGSTTKGTAGVFLIYHSYKYGTRAVSHLIPHVSRSFTTRNTLLSPVLSTRYLAVFRLLGPPTYSRADHQISVSAVVYRCSAFGRTIVHCFWIQSFHQKGCKKACRRTVRNHGTLRTGE